MLGIQYIRYHNGAQTLMMKLGLVVATLFLCFVLAERRKS